jgi:glycosyltransferase involved in cell wall biosynthesis
LIEIFRRVREHLPATLVLVGDGPEMAGARQRIADAGLESDVEYAGEILDVVTLFATADLFLLPSATESFGLAALEAMACEVPVIASRVGGLPEVIDDGISGFLHEPDDLDGMVASAVRLLTDGELHGRVAAPAARWPSSATRPIASCRSTKPRTSNCFRQKPSSRASIPAQWRPRAIFRL